MRVKDVLIGDTKIIVETENENYQFNKKSEDEVVSNQSIPEDVENALRERGYALKSDFSMEVNIYLHDEATPHDRKELADEIGVDESHDLVQQIMAVKNEAKLTVEIDGEDSWKITKFNGCELAQPYSW